MNFTVNVWLNWSRPPIAGAASGRLNFIDPPAGRMEEATMEYTVKQLTSGFWAVFAGDKWIDAAQPTQEAALAFVGRLKGEVTPA